MKKEMICITCPMSCRLELDIENNELREVTGNTCPRGITYANDEFYHPVRMLTSTVSIKNARYPRCPVITSKPIPKEKMMNVMQEINKICIEAPIKINDVIICEVCGLDANVIASRSMERK